MTNVVVIGAGPAGLAATLALKQCTPKIKLKVVDPSGCWFNVWDRQFANQDIHLLRSPAVHHPHPDPYRLLASSNPKDTNDLVSTAGTYLPTTRRFRAFIDEALAETELTDTVSAHRAVGLATEKTGQFNVLLDDGQSLAATRIILATNHRQPVIPVAIQPAQRDPHIRHSTTIDVRTVSHGQRIVIVGQGLTAAHLALGAAKRGAIVTLLTRRRMTVRNFDVHPTWLGPKKLRPFSLEPDLHIRHQAIMNARGGGSIPYRIDTQLQSCQSTHNLTIRERVTINKVDRCAPEIMVTLSTREHIATDELWLATGATCDITHDPLCHTLTKHAPTKLVNGLPSLAADLRWPGSNVHLMGFSAALQIGPSAGNLVGHRRAARLIADAINKQ